MKKCLISFLLVLVLLFIPLPVTADNTLHISSNAALVVEFDTGKILYAQDAEKRLPIASLTKILTVYLTLKEIKAGRLHWQDQVPISEYAKKLSENPEISNPTFTKDSYSVQELIDSSLIFSANSSAIALAEKVAGSEPKFVDKMKQQLMDWNISDFHIVNASGLNNTMLGECIYPGSAKTDENEMTAKDLAIISHHLISEFPEILKTTSQTKMTFEEEDFTNSNLLLSRQEMAYPGVDGLKTGTTENSGYSFIATALQDTMRVITVILNAKGEDSSRFSQTKTLLDYTYQTFEKKRIPKGHVFKEMVTIKRGKKEKIAVKTGEEMIIVKKKNTAKLSFQQDIKNSASLAPIDKNHYIGKIHFKDSDIKQTAYPGKKEETTIYTNAFVKKSNLIDKLLRFFKR
ncbi:D-alanyl-D-alanine carboxypeptidase [Streptococcus iniae]|uniref:D-alanyl-D-alanine carboxypeptidase PBP3 n=1 Tax=Streptococcus iniae TaxID=1346 RepID=UPI000B5ECDD7|nr:D-alanyl-D-alanine carboxypeptidase PBP3 [Streptococcus iniae]ASL34265.1 D-alanyl-D-alanine carboxypeptidase [Streptococcus iniae]